MKLKFLGAANTVTGSRTELTNGSGSVLVDCGLYQGPKDIRQKNWQPVVEASKYKALILTHAHVDHSGLIPLLVKQGFRGPVYCSPATFKLCKILLPDAGRLQEEDARFSDEKRHSKHFPALPLFTESDAFEALKYFKPVDYEKWQPAVDSIRFRLIRSGHILGSSFVEIGYESTDYSKRVLFSGDLAQPHPILLRDPVSITEADTLVLESTYGDRVHKTENRFDQLASVINKVLGRRGTLIIPAFSVGRTQDLLFMIRKLEEEKKIDIHDVYLDSPMALDATEIYKSYEEEVRPEIVSGYLKSSLSCARFKAVKSPDESMLLCMSDHPKIVISAAGMLSGGRVLHHLKCKLPNSKNGVLFVGYQVPGSKGYVLQNGISEIRLHHQEVTVNAEIFNMESLSAHADSNQIIQWLKAFRQKPKRIFLNHGESTPRQVLSYRIRHELGIDVFLPQESEEFKI